MQSFQLCKHFVDISSDSEHSDELESRHFVDISSDSEHLDELESMLFVDISSDSESMSDGSDSDWVQSNRTAVSDGSDSGWVQSNRKAEKHQRRDGCACSKSSSCKTNRCECRGSGAQCGAGCGCKDSKCSNRDSSTKEMANQGAMLLQNAFSEKEAQDAKPREPLTDIGNNAVSTVLYSLVL
jgi:kinesin family protein 4/21/27